MPVKYIPYLPNPIAGQALLNNIPRSERLLRYRDNDKVVEKIQRGLPYYDLETVEQVGEDNKGWNNLLLRGECLSACAYLKDQGITVDLVYIDPPFASGANYAKKVYLRRNPQRADQVAQAERELEQEGLQALEETMYGDIWQKEDYLNWMYENLMAIKSVMSETASIYVHLDWHIGHYVKILMDEVFGEDNFVNEIVWIYSGREMDISKWNPKHDCLYFYTKGEKFTFNTDHVREDYTEATENKYKYEDELGRFQIRGKAIAGSPVDRADGLSLEHEKKYPDMTYRQYSKGGTAPRDWWSISMVNKAAHERVDYPTQKPEALLERIIKASSDEGMIVADFFGGSGVTAKVAHDLGRKFIHCDVGINSLQTTRDRLADAGAGFQVMDIKDGVSLFRNPQQTMDKLAKLIPGLQQQVDGIGDFWFGAIDDSKLGIIPVYVPDLVNSSEKALDVPAVNRIINEELQKLDFDPPPAKAIAYYADIDDRSALENFIREYNPTLTDIELRDLKTVLDHIISNDEFCVSVAAQAGREGAGFSVRVTEFYSDRLQQKIAEYNDKRQLTGSNNSKPLLLSDEGLELIEWLAVDCKNADGPWHSSHEVKIDKNGYATIDGNKTRQFWDGTIVTTQAPQRIKIRNIAGDETIKPINPQQ